MDWGDAFKVAYEAATDAAKAAADTTMSSARAAADAVARTTAAAARAATAAVVTAKDAALRAASATKDAVVVGATAARDAAVASAQAVKRGATAAAQGASNLASFGARATGEVVAVGAGMVTSAATAPYRAVRQAFAPAQTPTQTVIEPCPATWEAKKARLEVRNELIGEGRRSPDPAERAAAARLAQNNEAVELARLSEDSYAAAPTQPHHTPPVGWSVVPDAELEAAGISPDALADARAVVYRSEPDWPGGQKTVLAFRGTADLEDGIVDHDQAMALDTRQYETAMLAGQQVSQGLGPQVLVTGHSLGGGKAQAAGAVGGLRGTMFNSAGLNPATVDGLMPAADQFSQYRTTGDPLTGVQNSPALQSAVVAVAGAVATPVGALMKGADWAQKAVGLPGLSPEVAGYAGKAFMALPRSVKNLVADGNLLPPAIGPVHTVRALGADGQPIAQLNPMGQHSITSAINGIEEQKTLDISTLGTGS